MAANDHTLQAPALALRPEGDECPRSLQPEDAEESIVPALGSYGLEDRPPASEELEGYAEVDDGQLSDQVCDLCQLSLTTP